MRVNDRKRPGRKTIRDKSIIAAVGAFVHLNPYASINDIIREFTNLSRTTVWRILRVDLKLKPYQDDYEPIMLGDNSVVYATGCGELRIPLTHGEIKLKKCFYVPAFTITLWSFWRSYVKGYGRR